MNRELMALTCMTIAVCCFAQEDLSKVLSFGTVHPGGRPGGWWGGPAGSLFRVSRRVDVCLLKEEQSHRPVRPKLLCGH